jgi:hypothetical protein
MYSPKKKTGVPPQHQPLVDLTNEKPVEGAGKQPDPTHSVQEIEELGSKRSKVVFPDFDQVLLSSFEAIGKFQLANESFNPSTAEIAANSPRYRRRSSTFIDGVHDLPDEKASPMAPAQLYSTMSGRLFHSGRIAIVLVGPPARGKT